MNRVIALGIAAICLASCVVLLATVNHGSPAPISLNSAQTAPANAVSFTDPALNSLIRTRDSRLSEISDHHSYGMCGSVHFYCFQYTNESDIAAIINANDFSVVEPATAVDGEMGMNAGEIGWSVWDSGMGGGPYWKKRAGDWHSVPASAEVYSGRVSYGRCYLFVDKPATSAYLEVACGYP